MIQNKTFTKEFFIELARKHQLNAGIFEALGSHRHFEIVVDELTFPILIHIQNQFERFEEMGDDEYRCFYIELPRPTLDEWGNCEDYENHEEYRRDWECYNPSETKWFHISSGKYRECRSIRIMDRKYDHFTITNQSTYFNNDKSNGEWYQDFLKNFSTYLQELVDAIISASDEFNDYIAKDLPYQQRDGRISRKEFNRINPDFKIKVEDEAIALRALEDSVNGNLLEPLKEMTIRKYCKYFRIAHEAYNKHFNESEYFRERKTISIDITDGDPDVEYYKRVKYGYLDDSFNLDSQEDFKKFAKNLYCEIGFSRLNIYASSYDIDGWRIIVSNSYSSYVDIAIDVATALYKNDVPIEIHDAETFLKILKEEDYVKLTPHTFHDYMSWHEEGTVYELPWEYDLKDKAADEGLTREQYNQIISLAEWEEGSKIKPKMI